jgi:hypothetical protein
VIFFFSTKQNWAGAKVFNSGNKKLGAEVEKKVKKIVSGRSKKKKEKMKFVETVIKVIK